jgi:hypothetical protein
MGPHGLACIGPRPPRADPGRCGTLDHDQVKVTVTRL